LHHFINTCNKISTCFSWSNAWAYTWSWSHVTLLILNCLEYYLVAVVSPVAVVESPLSCSVISLPYCCICTVHTRTVLRTDLRRSRSRSYFMTGGQSVSMSWYRAPLCDLWPDITSYRNVAQNRSQSYFTTDGQSVSQYVVVSDTPFGRIIRFYFFYLFSRKIVFLFVLVRPLWREDRSVICSPICQWSVEVEVTTSWYRAPLSDLRRLTWLFACKSRLYLACCVTCKRLLVFGAFTQLVTCKSRVYRGRLLAAVETVLLRVGLAMTYGYLSNAAPSSWLEEPFCYCSNCPLKDWKEKLKLPENIQKIGEFSC
jgi:hypothetical protein